MVAPTFEEESLSDGGTVVRRFESGKLVSSVERHTFSSGRQMSLNYDSAHQLVNEVHSYGILKIAIDRKYKDGKKIEEILFYNKRLVSRKTYSKARLESYPDMPEADNDLVDIGAELNELVRRDRQQQRRQAAKHVPDAERAKESDAFCTKLIAGTDVDNAYIWINMGQHTLGEMSRVQSKRLITRLEKLSCPKVYVCDIEIVSESAANSGNLVAELPLDATQRRDVLKVVSRIVEKQGFQRVLDDGQRYVYIKLD